MIMSHTVMELFCRSLGFSLELFGVRFSNRPVRCAGRSNFPLSAMTSQWDVRRDKWSGPGQTTVRACA